MHIKSIKLKNFRCYENAEFNFKPGFNLVIGLNGSGKTSLLLGVATSFKGIGSATSKGSPSISEDDARFVIDQHEDRIRFERRYPVEINAEGNFLGTSTWGTSKERSGNVLDLKNNTLYNGMTSAIQEIDAGKDVTLPLVAFYRANRRWSAKNTSAEYAATQKTSRYDAYLNWYDAAVDLQEFESWIIGKTLERLQKIARKNNKPATFTDELQLLDDVLTHALPNSAGIEYDLDLRQIIVKLSKNHSIPFNDLSDGQRSLVAIVSDITRRICVLNPHLRNDALTLTPGTILIDEIDIHLHPAWQRNIISALKNSFPQIQFIAASHSPQVIGSLSPEEIIILTENGPTQPKASYGLDSSSILEEVMDTAQRAPEVANTLSEILSAIENNKLAEAKQQLNTLKATAKDLPEYYRIEALLKRKELLGK